MPTEQKGGERLEHRLREQLPMFSPASTGPRAATAPTLYNWQTFQKTLSYQEQSSAQFKYFIFKYLP